MEDAARRYNSKILSCLVNKLRISSQSTFVPVKDRIGVTISDKKRVKEKWAEHLRMC